MATWRHEPDFDSVPFDPPEAVVTSGLARGPWGFPKVAGKCPSCGAASLFLAVGGHVTCAVIGCADPCAADDLLQPREG